MNCSTCIHWERNPQFVEPAPQPREVRWFWGLVKFTVEPDEWDMLEHSIRAERAKAGRCHRYPKSHQTSETYRCGEYAHLSEPVLPAKVAERRAAA